MTTGLEKIRKYMYEFKVIDRLVSAIINEYTSKCEKTNFIQPTPIAELIYGRTLHFLDITRLL